MSTSTKTEVIIIGAGPTGLALACQLIRYGIDFVIVDKKETTTPYSKAIGVQARTLEIYEQIGLADKLIELGAIAERARMIVGGEVRGEANFREFGKGMSPYPFVLIVEQGLHEKLLYDHIRSSGRDVRWKTELQNFAQSKTGVTAVVRSADGNTESVEAQFLVGCDGAKSPVRHGLGLTFEGSTFDRMFYVADVKIEWDFPHDAGHAFLLKNNLLVFFPMTGERQWRIVGTFPEEFAKDEGDVLYDEIEEQIKRDAELDLDITEVNWFSTYRVHTRRVNKFSEGRCFLAGDSAHIHTPAGAQGMNTGIQDAYNLAWKLAMVLRGTAGEKLLDTYNEERLENAKNLLETTDRFFNLAASPEPIMAFLRTHVFPYVAGVAFSIDAVKKFLFPRVSQIGINYRHGALSNHTGDESFAVKAGDRMPYFIDNGESIYDRLHQPKFHLLHFSASKSDFPFSRMSSPYAGLLDQHEVRIVPHVADIFGTERPFNVLLRPDNHVATISSETSLAPIENYFEKVSMKTVLFALILFALSFTVAVGQTPTPTAAPTATPVVDDKQNVSPDKLQGVPAIAPNYSSEDRSMPDLGRVGVDMAVQRSLTLNDAITLALENNKDIEVTRKNVKIAEFDLLAARGVFQPRLSGQTFYERSTVPNVSIFSSNRTTTQGSFVGNAGVTGYVPQFGTVLRGDFNNTRLTTDNPISILSPQTNANLTFSITQPIFRGRSFDPNRRAIEIAKRNLSLTDVQFRQRSIEIIAAVQRAYWDLTYSLRNLQVQRDGVRDAKEQLGHNRRLVEEGQLAPIDIVAAETQVANFEQSVYEALNGVTQAENALKNLIAPSRTAELWSESITPVDPVDLDAPRTSLTEALDAALQNRLELEINEAQKDINAVDQRLYRELKKPQIDLVASYSSAGIGGSQNPDFNPNFPTPCSTNPASPACQQQQGNLAALTGNPYSGIFQNKYPTFRVGVQFNLPLFGDKTAGAQLGRAIVEGERLDVQRQQIEQNIQVDVRNALQTLRTAEARLRAAAISRENSARQYESEQRKLDNGQSDIYRVLERQTALTSARSAELRAQTELNKAISDLQRATGNSLKANNVVTKLIR